MIKHGWIEIGVRTSPLDPSRFYLWRAKEGQPIRELKNEAGEWGFFAQDGEWIPAEGYGEILCSSHGRVEFEYE